MDGEQRSGQAGRPDPRPADRAPTQAYRPDRAGSAQPWGSPAADPGATQVYGAAPAGTAAAGAVPGRPPADQGATQVYGAAPAGTVPGRPPADPAATRVYGGVPAGTASPGAGPGRPWDSPAAAPTQAFGRQPFPDADAAPGRGAGYGSGPGYAGPGSGYGRPDGFPEPQRAGDPFPQQPFGAAEPFPADAGAGHGTVPGGGFGATGGPGGPGGTGRRGPSRGVILATLSLAVLAAVGVGVAVAMNRSDDTATTAASSPPPTTTGPATTAATTTPTPTDSPAATTPSVTASSPTTTATVLGPAPTGWQEQPWSYPGMDFGTIVGVKPGPAGTVQITARRQQFLTGDAAKAYYEQHPDEEPLDYAIVDVGTKPHKFAMSADALIYAQYLLGDGSAIRTTQLTPADFVTRTEAVLAKKLPLHVWLYHRKSANGTVVYLAEQYTP